MEAKMLIGIIFFLKKNKPILFYIVKSPTAMPRNLSSHPRITASSHILLARHYHPALSIWLSVDPMGDKYLYLNSI